jgi:hypothetical protein
MGGPGRRIWRHCSLRARVRGCFGLWFVQEKENGKGKIAYCCCTVNYGYLRSGGRAKEKKKKESMMMRIARASAYCRRFLLLVLVTSTYW